MNSPRNPVAVVPNARMIAWPKRCAPECTRDPLNMHRARADQMIFSAGTFGACAFSDTSETTGPGAIGFTVAVQYVLCNPVE